MAGSVHRAAAAGLTCDEVRQFRIEGAQESEHIVDEEHGVIISIEHPLVRVAIHLRLEHCFAACPSCRRDRRQQAASGRLCQQDSIWAHMVGQVWRKRSPGVPRVQASGRLVVREVPPRLLAVLPACLLLCCHH